MEVTNSSVKTEECHNWVKKNILQRFKSRLGEAEERISQLKEKAVELIQLEQQKRKKNGKKVKIT